MDRNNNNTTSTTRRLRHRRQKWSQDRLRLEKEAAVITGVTGRRIMVAEGESDGEER